VPLIGGGGRGKEGRKEGRRRGKEGRKEEEEV